MVTILASAVILASFAVFTFFILSTVMFRKPAGEHRIHAAMPPVAMLKPVMGIDDELETNLESFYLTEYPGFEVIFGVETIDDPCVPLLEKLKVKHPGIPTKIIQTSRRINVNPKINTLSHCALHTECNVYWVTDSSTRVDRDTLYKLMHEYSVNGSKIVFSPIMGTGSRSIGSIMRNAYLNTFVSGGVLVAWKFFRQPIVVGKSMLVEKDALNTMGGFNRFKEYLAEDYIMGETYHETAILVSTNCTWVTDYNSSATIADFFFRMARWAKLRFHNNTVFYLLEILTNPVGLALLALAVPGSHAGWLLLWTVTAKVILEYVSLFLINTGDNRKAGTLLLYPFCVILKDVLLLVVYFIPIFDRSVRWRGKSFHIGSKTRIQTDPYPRLGERSLPVWTREVFH